MPFALSFGERALVRNIGRSAQFYRCSWEDSRGYKWAWRDPEAATQHEGLCVFGHTAVCDPFQTNAQVCPARGGIPAEQLVELQQLCCLCGSAIVQEHVKTNKVPSSAAQALGQCVWDMTGPQEQKNSFGTRAQRYVRKFSCRKKHRYTLVRWLQSWEAAVASKILEPDSNHSYDGVNLG